MRKKESTIRKCKNIRDQTYDRDQLANAVFKRKVLELISPESTVLDLGCGRKASFLHSLSCSIKNGYGLDLEVYKTTIDGNIQIMHGDSEAIPLRDQSVDVITLINVVEHLRDPERTFSECKRVLVPGGSLVLMTPNKSYPPILIGRLFPHSIRQWANLAITGTQDEDTFPTYYRANSVGALSNVASLTGLGVTDVQYLSDHPRYFMFSTLVYRFAVIIDRHVLERKAFRRFRARIFCHFINGG